MSKHQHEHQHQHQNPKQQQKQEQQPQEPDDQKDTNQTQAAEPREEVFEIGMPIDVRQINMPRKRDQDCPPKNWWQKNEYSCLA